MGLVKLIGRQTKWIIAKERKDGIELVNTCNNKTVIEKAINNQITNRIITNRQKTIAFCQLVTIEQQVHHSCKYTGVIESTTMTVIVY